MPPPGPNRNLDQLDRLADDPSAGAEMHEARGLRLEAQARLAEAAQALTRALELEPGRRSAIEARARVALNLRAADAVPHCRRALAFHAADPQMQLQMIEVAASHLGTAALPLFEEFVHAHPGDVAALERLADLRAQNGEGDRFADHFESSIARFPERRDIPLALARTLSRSLRHENALDVVERARVAFGDSADLDLLEAQVALHAGLDARAESRLARLGGGPQADLARAQFFLQTARPDAAAPLLQSIIDANPDDLAAWALLAVAWRLQGDARHAWLCEQPGLCQALPLPLADGDLAAVARSLRALHTAREQPLGQSVRGGTQTAGFLFAREDPDLLRLRNALAEAVGTYLAGLPAFDPSHPLLRHRNGRLAFGPSWSVRLAGGGFHVPHLHPGGILSSACYVSVPDGLGASGSEEGWLELGRPPPELKTDLPPIMTIRPRSGVLALFPSYLFHGTRPFAAGERLTVAFDVVAS
jgi:tetratricopeptide (TPR) repeat protein